MSTPIPDGSVIITPIEMYREQQATHQAVQQMSAKLDGVVDTYSRRLDGLDRGFSDHEDRLRQLQQQTGPMADHESRLTAVEKKVWAVAGVFATLGAGVSIVTAVLTGKP